MGYADAFLRLATYRHSGMRLACEPHSSLNKADQSPFLKPFLQRALTRLAMEPGAIQQS